MVPSGERPWPEALKVQREALPLPTWPGVFLPLNLPFLEVSYPRKAA